LSRKHAIAVLFAVLLLTGAEMADPHPLGNFTISHYTGIEVRGDSIMLHYVIDMAEIPTFQEMQEIGITSEEDLLRSQYLKEKLESLKRGLVLNVNGARVALATEGERISFPPGVGGLITMRIEGEFKTRFGRDRLAPRNDVRYVDTNFEGRAGWKEIVVYGSGSAVLGDSSAATVDQSQRLLAYPQNRMNNPPQDLSARFTFTLGAPGRSTQPPQNRGTALETSGPDPEKIGGIPERIGRPGRGAPAEASIPETQARGNSQWDVRFMRLITKKDGSRSVLLLSFFLAMLLGAFHALEPGHGKTLVAAYLVGSRGTSEHALLLGIIVTASHTAGVFLLGVVTLYFSKYIFPEHLYPWVGFSSGIAIAGIGLIMFSRRIRGISNHSHPHPHPGGAIEAVSLRDLLALGITGGIVPCPAALVVLLGAISLGRVGFGLLLIVAFSVGLAAVLVAIGLLMVYAGRLMVWFREDNTAIVRWLPLVSSAFITILGVIIAAQGLVRTGILRS
jgi:ABC-type nickel/cobalt efflux system permease component RcnA